MRYKLLQFWIVVFTLIFSVNAASNLFECNWRTDACQGSEAEFIYANQHFFPDGEPEKVLSSNVAIAADGNYSKILCCKINSGANGEDLGSISVSNLQKDIICPTAQNSGTEELMFYTNHTNARVGFPDYAGFNISYFNYKMCVLYPDRFSHLNILVSDDGGFSSTGYECLYRTNNLTNGHVSDCDATFDGGKQYQYTVWAKLWENVESLKCNADCTSRLDGRVYQACSLQISECANVPAACDGSIYGAWVDTGTKEVQCSSPWNIERGKQVTSEEVKISSVGDECSNIIKKGYQVILNNEPVVMNIYVCND